MYITWSTPTDPNPTWKRIEWACLAANWDNHSGTQTEEDVADAIWNALAGDPPWEPTSGRKIKDGATWELLDGVYSGECDEQANLMKRAMNILGVTASVQLIRASHDTADLFDQESMEIGGRTAWLVMDFNVDNQPDPPFGSGWNAFEGCCFAANKWYAVWPHRKEASALDMFHNLSFEQFWVYTVGNKKPGDGKLEVEGAADPNVVPKYP
jgi:hypothetical protein